MNKIVSKFLLAGNKFMPEMHLKQPHFTYSACGPFTKNKELKNLCSLETQILFTEMSLIRPVFSMIWLMVNQDLIKRTQSDKVLRYKAFKIASNPKYDGYQRGLDSMVYKFFDKKFSRSGVAASLANKSDTKPNYQLANELHRQITRKITRRKVYSSFGDIIWGVDLADMQSLSK